MDSKVTQPYMYMDPFSPKLSYHCYWILVKMPNSVVAFYDQNHKYRKLVS